VPKAPWSVRQPTDTPRRFALQTGSFACFLDEQQQSAPQLASNLMIRPENKNANSD